MKEKKQKMRMPIELLSKETRKLYESGVPLHKAIAMEGLNKKEKSREKEYD